MSDEIIDAEVITEGIEVPRNEEIIDAVEHGMQKMYLSGPMDGLEEFNHPLFNRVAAEFRQVGFAVCTPSEFFDGDKSRERKEYMREAVKYLLEADTIVLLPGWEDSKGARLEAAIATELDLSIMEYVERDDTDAPEGQQFAATFTPVDDDGSELQKNLGSFTPVEETTKETE
jgi:hypothetical protein